MSSKSYSQHLRTKNIYYWELLGMSDDKISKNNTKMINRTRKILSSELHEKKKTWKYCNNRYSDKKKKKTLAYLCIQSWQNHLCCDTSHWSVSIDIIYWVSHASKSFSGQNKIAVNHKTDSKHWPNFLHWYQDKNIIQENVEGLK